MTDDAATADRGPDRRPILFIVDADDAGRAATVSALHRRFGSDYRVVAAASAETGLPGLVGLSQQGEEVALVGADIRLPDTDGVEFLERAQALHPGASRALLVPMGRRGTRIPLDDLATLQRATALGRIDFSITKGWVTPEEWLYPQVQAALSVWTAAHRPHHEVVRVVGERWSPPTHELRDALTRNTVPIGFYAVDSAAGARLVQEYGVDTTRLPAAAPP